MTPQDLKLWMSANPKTAIICIFVVLLAFGFIAGMALTTNIYNEDYQVLLEQARQCQPRMFDFEALESPQKHFRIGDKFVTTDEFWMWKGETTSFGGWIIGIGENGSVNIKVGNGAWKGFDGNNYTINEYWLEPTGEHDPEGYKGWYWP